MDGGDHDLNEARGANGKNRRSGVTISPRIAVGVSLALVLQYSYGVYVVGRQSEKLDTVAVDVAEIKRAQYTQRDAERDLTPLRRADDQLHGRVRDLELRVFNQPGR